ncbi:hypothetical protein DAI22_01g150600 [Oryza sativa Japonica Group]|nr:hypothetical protein DAI22_01g150600 [Oryza sativa Japonica Group]KAF2949893.1 hypothetical protein DAI22_01g150600 [Oryza sativa Japonica Group]
MSCCNCRKEQKKSSILVFRPCNAMMNRLLLLHHDIQKFTHFLLLRSCVFN